MTISTGTSYEVFGENPYITFCYPVPYCELVDENFLLNKNRHIIYTKKKMILVLCLISWVNWLDFTLLDNLVIT